VLPFTDRMAEAMAACDLIVSRAGASTLAEIQAVGKPSILLPYPYHRDQHQRYNAMVLVEAGAAVLLDDSRDAADNARRLRPVLAALMKDDRRREAMGRAARGLDNSDPAQSIASALLDAAAGNHGAACELCAGPAVNSLSRRIA
jgi:UDP-N-acetylglucosamine--N-acetylmuramyl-(pentapeptide) pyrophosphoryl-undecaprenol N-acetylglucosamine transferase